MTGAPTPVPTDWLSIPEVAELIGQSAGRVRQLVAERHLLSSRRQGPVTIPAVFFVDDAPLSSLRGTAFVLHDAGFDDDEAIDWLLTPEDSIGMAPIEALRAGRKSEVRRVAQTLA